MSADKDENVNILDGLILDDIKMTSKELQKEKIRNMKKEKEKVEKIEEKILTQAVETSVKEVRPELISERQELILALQDYANDDVVGKFLDSLHFDLSVKKLEKLSIEELRELLTAIQRASNSKSLNLFWNSLVMGGIRVFEILFSLSRWKDKILLGGLHEDLKTDEDWNFSLRCFFLENRKVFYMRPSLRLFFMMIQKIIHRHTINSGARQVAQLLNGLATTELKTPGLGLGQSQSVGQPQQPVVNRVEPDVVPPTTELKKQAVPPQPVGQPQPVPPQPAQVIETQSVSIARKAPFLSPSPIMSGLSCSTGTCSLDSSDIDEDELAQDEKHKESNYVGRPVGEDETKESPVENL